MADCQTQLEVSPLLKESCKKYGTLYGQQILLTPCVLDPPFLPTFKMPQTNSAKCRKLTLQACIKCHPSWVSCINKCHRSQHPTKGRKGLRQRATWQNVLPILSLVRKCLPEIVTGQLSCLQIKATEAQERRILPASHPDVLLVKRIFQRIVQSALKGKGGGYQEHMKVDLAFYIQHFPMKQ